MGVEKNGCPKRTQPNLEPHTHTSTHEHMPAYTHVCACVHTQEALCGLGSEHGFPQGQGCVSSGSGGGHRGKAKAKKVRAQKEISKYVACLKDPK